MAISKNLWKKRLQDLRTLQGVSGTTTHKRIEIAVWLFENEDFRAGIYATDDIAVIEFLDDFFHDFRLFADLDTSPFLKLRAIFRHFPDANDWVSGDLATLYEKTLAAVPAESTERPKITRRHVKRSEYEAVVEERDDLKAQIARYEGMVDNLTRENRELREKLANTMGRLEELQRYVDGKLRVA